MITDEELKAMKERLELLNQMCLRSDGRAIAEDMDKLIAEVERYRAVFLSPEAAEQLLDLIENPPEPSASLIALGRPKSP